MIPIRSLAAPMPASSYATDCARRILRPIRRCLVALSVCAFSSALPAIEVLDTFDTGNPNQWGWTNSGGSVYVLQPKGGKPGGWLDSGTPYYADHPNLTSIPPPGSALRRALDSGSLLTASFDFQRLDPGCFPQSTTASTFALELIDLHSDPGGAVISAHVNGPPSPAKTSHWQSVGFTVPSDATGVPAGWVIDAPPELSYTWSDLMRNIDGIRFFSVSPDDVTFSACWQLGADNVSITYSEDIFADGFDSTP